MYSFDTVCRQKGYGDFMISDMIASVKQAETTASELIAKAQLSAEKIRADSLERAENLKKEATEKAEAKTAAMVAELKSSEESEDVLAAAQAANKAAALKQAADKKGDILKEKIAEILFS
jgi:vacuolar-type H+-ATPase subunit H